jgi:hypothetical protein
MELLADMGLVESRFDPSGDSVSVCLERMLASVQDRCTVVLKVP